MFNSTKSKRSGARESALRADDARHDLAVVAAVGDDVERRHARLETEKPEHRIRLPRCVELDQFRRASRRGNGRYITSG
jgi:hypothetical protein